jgi:hypothetical protein
MQVRNVGTLGRGVICGARNSCNRCPNATTCDLGRQLERGNLMLTNSELMYACRSCFSVLLICRRLSPVDVWACPELALYDRTRCLRRSFETQRVYPEGPRFQKTNVGIPQRLGCVPQAAKVANRTLIVWQGARV